MESLDDRARRAASVISMDDLEAAQALEGLRSDFGQSPRASRPNNSTSSDPPQPEPLLSLLTSSHPLISSAINGSVSAYATSKSYSARFKSGAEFIERNIGSPVANTVGTVGRKTGVESGLRWALQRRDSARDATHSSKRRKVNAQMAQDMDVERGPEEVENQTKSQSQPRTRSSSDLSMTETLPPYDDMRSPRLTYCLTWLRWANGRLGRAIVALQNALTEWDSHKKNQSQQNDEGGDSSSLLTQRIQAVKADVLSTLKQVVDVVSKYAGGALPENARHLVRRHLTSLPHRFQMASTSQPPPGSVEASTDATVGAHRILVLAHEGLDILGQVSGVVNDTLVSAEHWCDRLGRKRPDNKSAPDAEKQNTPGPMDAQPYPTDIKQPILTEPASAPQEDVQMAGTEKV
ncbi:uncharacterized protein N7483_002769 [Penicillium malachiteum]|uniref:uncharacterized protein n=1 Tax=Penicillium malachiteum TaxID=1324776 RepID=UPI002546F054|nr:uncharacterized protein N7483_002769 [Penicillium malachiteum]KAJ5737644.1 hypothetical protein N7483_002769 [Penicillium malachiteum]